MNYCQNLVFPNFDNIFLADQCCFGMGHRIICWFKLTLQILIYGLYFYMDPELIIVKIIKWRGEIKFFVYTFQGHVIINRLADFAAQCLSIKVSPKSLQAMRVYCHITLYKIMFFVKWVTSKEKEEFPWLTYTVGENHWEKFLKLCNYNNKSILCVISAFCY